jgi:hypothetical protein
MTRWTAILLAVFVLAPIQAGAATIGPFGGTLDSSDPSMSNRLSRNGVTSTCVGKAFPGTLPGPVSYETFDFFNSGPAECVSVSFTGTLDNFGSAYANFFDPTNLALNYLGDAGASSTSERVFSFLAPADSVFVIVANSISSLDGESFSFTVTGDSINAGTTPTAVPEPTSLLLFSTGAAGLLVRRRRRVPVA